MPDLAGKSDVHPQKWAPLAPQGADLTGGGFVARRVWGLGQTLVSGDLDLARAQLAPGASILGLWSVAEALPALVRIARDRALLVSEAPLDLSDGWQNGYALSDAGDAWAVLDIEGEALGDIVAEGTSADLGRASPSASTLFAGVPALLTRTSPATARLHVEAPLLPYLWRWLETRVG